MRARRYGRLLAGRGRRSVTPGGGAPVVTVAIRLWNLDPADPSGTAKVYRGVVPFLLSDAVVESEASGGVVVDSVGGAQLDVFTRALQGGDGSTDAGPIWHGDAHVGADGRYDEPTASRPVQAAEVEVLGPSGIAFGTYRDVTYTLRGAARTAATRSRQGFQWAANAPVIGVASSAEFARLTNDVGIWPFGAAAPTRLAAQDLPRPIQWSTTLATYGESGGFAPAVTAGGSNVTATYYLLWDQRANAGAGGLLVSSNLIDPGLAESFKPDTYATKVTFIARYQVTVAAGTTYTPGVTSLTATGITFVPLVSSATMPYGWNQAVQTPDLPKGLLCLAPSEATRACASGIAGRKQSAPVPKTESDARAADAQGCKYSDHEVSDQYWYAFFSAWGGPFGQGAALGRLEYNASYETSNPWAVRYAMDPHARWLVYLATATRGQFEQYVEGLHTSPPYYGVVANEWNFTAAGLLYGYFALGDEKNLARVQMNALGLMRRFLEDAVGARSVGTYTARIAGCLLRSASACLRARVPYPSTWWTYANRVTRRPTSGHSGWEDILDHALATVEARVLPSGELPTLAVTCKDDRNQDTTYAAQPLMTGQVTWGCEMAAHEAAMSLSAAGVSVNIVSRAVALNNAVIDWQNLNAWDGPTSGTPTWPGGGLGGLPTTPVVRLYNEKAGWVYLTKDSYIAGGANNQYFRWDATATHPNGPPLGAFVDVRTAGGTWTHGRDYGGWGPEGVGGYAFESGTSFPGYALALETEADATKKARSAEVLDHMTRRARAYKATSGAARFSPAGTNNYLIFSNLKAMQENSASWGRGLQALKTYQGW